MKMPEMEFYPISDLANRWDCTEYEIINLIENGKLHAEAKTMPVKCAGGTHSNNIDLLLSEGYAIKDVAIVMLDEIKRFEADSKNNAKSKTPPTAVKPKKPTMKSTLLEIVATLPGNYTSNDVRKAAKRISKDGKHPVIQEVKSEFIYWQTVDGKEKKMTLEALQKRLTNIRKEK